MRRSVVGLVLMVVVVWGPPVLGAEGNPAKGKEIYDKNCHFCHGVEGKGDGPAGRMLTPPPTNFKSPTSSGKSDAELLRVIESGTPGTGMPAWKGKLSEREIQDVLAYIRQLAK